MCRVSRERVSVCVVSDDFSFFFQNYRNFTNIAKTVLRKIVLISKRLRTNNFVTFK